MSQGPWTAPGAPPPPEPSTYPQFQGGYPSLGIGAPAGVGPTRRTLDVTSVRSLRPGIVPLHPLALGDVLGGAVRLVRFNPSATIGLSIIVQFLVLSVAIPFALVSARNLGRFDAAEGPNPTSTMSLYLAQLPTALAAIALSALLSYVTLQAVLGQKPDAAATWRATRRQVFAYIGVCLAIGVGIAAIVTPLVLLALNGGALAVAGGVIGLVVALAGAWLGVRLMFLGPVMVLERAGPREALRRTWTLTRTRFWPILGTYLLAGFAANIAGSVIQTPVVMILTVFGMISFGADPAMLAVLTTLGSLLARAASGAVLSPFLAGVTSLLYVDTRMRTEGLDIALMDDVARSLEAP